MLRGFKEYSRHIDKLIEKQMSKELENNRLRLKTSVECARWVAFQACLLEVMMKVLIQKIGVILLN